MPFSPEKRREYDRNRQRSSQSRNGARTVRRETNTLQFVGIDGEGVTRPDGTHDYNLLSMGTQSLHHADGRRLTTEEIFTWLWQNHDPKACYVGFFLGYDFAQWFKDLPQERAWRLLSESGVRSRQRVKSGGNPTPFSVRWKQWEFDLLAGKRFKLKPYKSKAPWLIICDAGPIYQTAFIKAINPADWPEPICTTEEYQTILEGKAARGIETIPLGTPVNPETIEYNILENDLLSRLMVRTNEGLMAMEVKLRRDQWYGPGQAAQRWLLNTAPAHQGKAIREAAEPPEEAWQAAQGSYFGGWFEIFAHGPIPGITWEYDINSAYPAITATLPCLLHGQWIHHNVTGSPYTLIKARVKGSNPLIGAMLHRTSKGRVLRPSETEGWFWAHEIAAAQTARLIDHVDILESWTYMPCNCEPPFAAMRELYDHRLRVGKSSPQGKAAKLVYNSSYGKMAQSVGHPKFGNPVYASLITAGCRTMILDAIATHPQGTEAVIMVATDGVYFTSPHPTIPISPNQLGAWDVTEKQNLSLFKPGVYWDDATRAALKAGGRLKLKSRGVNERALAKWIPDLDQQWQNFQLIPKPELWPVAELAIPFAMITPKQALNRNKWDLCGTIEDAKAVKFSAWPGDKRKPLPPDNPPDSLHRTKPWPIVEDGVSTPYQRTFGQEYSDEELAVIMTMDGPANMLMEQALHQ